MLYGMYWSFQKGLEKDNAFGYRKLHQLPAKTVHINWIILQIHKEIAFANAFFFCGEQCVCVV